MKLHQYLQIRAAVENSTFEKDGCIASLKILFPSVSEDCLVSIFSLIHQRRIKSSFSIHHQKEAVSKYARNFWSAVERKEPAGILYRMARDIQIPPSSLARVILEDHLRREHGKDIVKQVITKFLKNPVAIDNQILACEVAICIEKDDFCGPRVESIKLEMGLKFENFLHEMLREKGIPYYEEAILRKHGYDKTPDFKLVCPIAVDSHVVNWIESKASFGDSESHSSYLEDQFWSYTNRFGPGMVIYWFGFIDELNMNIEKGILLKDRFPDNVVTLGNLLDNEISYLRKFESSQNRSQSGFL